MAKAAARVFVGKTLSVLFERFHRVLADAAYMRHVVQQFYAGNGGEARRLVKAQGRDARVAKVEESASLRKGNAQNVADGGGRGTSVAKERDGLVLLFSFYGAVAVGRPFKAQVQKPLVNVLFDIAYDFCYDVVLKVRAVFPVMIV